MKELQAHSAAASTALTTKLARIEILRERLVYTLTHQEEYQGDMLRDLIDMRELQSSLRY